MNRKPQSIAGLAPGHSDEINGIQQVQRGLVVTPTHPGREGSARAMDCCSDGILEGVRVLTGRPVVFSSRQSANVPL